VASDSDAGRRLILRSWWVWIVQALLWLGLVIATTSTMSRALCLAAAAVSTVVAAVLRRRPTAVATSEDEAGNR
jgi:hypothetical protein